MSSLFKRLSLTTFGKPANSTAQNTEKQGDKKQSAEKKPQDGKKKPPPPKPDGNNSWRLDPALLKSVVPDDLAEKELSLFKDLMGGESVPSDITLLHLGISLGLFENYLLGLGEKKGSSDKKSVAEEEVKKYTWVFYTENELGTRLLELLVNLQNAGSIKKEGDSYYVVEAATL